LRRWGFRYIAGLPDPSGVAAMRGKRVHKLLENWSIHGRRPPQGTDDGVIANALLPYAPGPGIALVEGDFWFDYWGIRYRGLKDLLYPENGFTVVHDWKVTSSFDWALTKEKLLTNPQALIYALDAFTRQEASAVALRWVYATSGAKPRTRVVETTITPEETIRGFHEHVHKPALRLVQLRRTVDDPRSLKPNPFACSKYPPEGCPFRAVCPLSRLEKLEAMVTNMDATKLKERIGGAPANGQVAFPSPGAAFPSPAPALSAATPPPQYVAREHILRMHDGSLAVQVSDQSYAPVADDGQGQFYISGPLFNPYAPAVPTHQAGDISQPPTQAPPAAAAAAEAPVAEKVRKAKTAAAVAAEGAPEEKKKPGRPPGSKTRVLSIEQQVYMMGVQATMANPAYAQSCTESQLQLSGQMAIRAFQAQFGED